MGRNERQRQVARARQSRLGIKKPHLSYEVGFMINPGSVLLSHAVAHAVPSALKVLTSEFGMGSGISPSTLPPETFGSLCFVL